MAETDLLDALLAVSRTTVARAARPLAARTPEVTAPQFRALVTLSIGGSQHLAGIARELGITPSAATRMCDRLVRKGLIRRSRPGRDRRVVYIALTPPGRTLVTDVTHQRRAELARIVTAIPHEDYVELVDALRVVAAAADGRLAGSERRKRQRT